MVGNTTLHEALKEHSFTAGLSDPQVAKLSGLARQVSFEENDLILIACEQSKHFYLLLSGSVCVEARMRAYTVCIQVLGPGDAFGWSSLLDQHDTLFQVRARERSVALCLDGADLSAAFRHDPDLAAEMLRRALKLVAGRVQATEAKLAEFCGMRIRKSGGQFVVDGADQHLRTK
jgi:CRP-like cAMP-binding protein